MRIDTDTYVWGVAKIILERKDEGRTIVRLLDESGDECQITFCTWGVGNMAHRSHPSIAVIENSEERELVAAGANPLATVNLWEGDK